MRRHERRFFIATDGAVTKQAKKRIGAPSMYTEKLAARICAGISAGKSLEAVCREPGMPCSQTVREWLRDPEKASFAASYARAREDQADALFDDIVAIADEAEGGDKAAINLARLRIDARKWVTGRMRPLKYGDRSQVDITSGGKPLTSQSQRDAAVAAAIRADE